MLSKLEQISLTKLLIQLFWSICIYLSGFYSAEAQWSKAQNLFDQADYKRAAIEFERIIYYENFEEASRNLCLLKKALCYKALGDYAKAGAILQRASLYDKTDLNVLKDLYVESVVAHYLSGEFPLAHRKILQAKSILPDTLTSEVLIYEPLVLFELHRYDEMEESLSIVSNQTKDSFFLTISNNLDRKSLKDPKKASSLSFLVPGLGMVYSGAAGKGLLSATLQLASVAYGAYGLYYGYFFTAAVPGIGLFYTFYTGGARFAETLAIRKNEKLRNDWRELLIRHLEQQSE